MKQFVVMGLVFLTSAAIAFAQSTNDLFNQSVAAGTAYRMAHAQYIQAKNQHQQYQTGATRVEAINKTNAALIKRNDWYLNYLRFLRQSLSDASNIANYANTVVYLDLENQINDWSNSADLGSGSNFSDINSRSVAWEKELVEVDKMVVVTQMQIAAANLANFQNQLIGFVSAFKQAHPTLTSSQATTVSLIEDKLNTSINKRKSVDEKLINYKSSQGSVGNFNKDLKDNQLLLLDAAKLLEELTHQT